MKRRDFLKLCIAGSVGVLGLNTLLGPAPSPGNIIKFDIRDPSEVMDCSRKSLAQWHADMIEADVMSALEGLYTIENEKKRLFWHRWRKTA